MTAEEFLYSTDIGSVSLNGQKFYPRESLEKAMKEFAKYHVELALKEASEKARAFNKGKFPGDINPQVDMDSILNAYPLENIK